MVKKMAVFRLYTYCFIIMPVFLSSVNGQYYHPNEYFKHSAPWSPRSADSHSFDDVAIIARNTPLQFLVEDVLETTGGADLEILLDLDLPLNNVSENCANDFNQFMMNITEPYALQMLDAAGKFPSGLLQGNSKWWGRYDQCRSVRADDSHDFNGGYCMTTLVSTDPNSLIPSIQLGLCVPDSCTASDVDALIRSGVLEVPLQILDYEPSSYCEQLPDTTAGFIIAVIIFSILGSLIVAGTTLEIAQHFLKMLHEPENADNVAVGEECESASERASEIHDTGDTVGLVASPSGNKPMKWIVNFLLCFSAWSNGNKILKVQSSDGPHSHLAALNGIRVLSMFWVILGHTHGLIIRYIDNGLITLDVSKRLSFQVINNSPFSVDSFFVLSGLLVCYFALTELEAKDGRIPWGRFYFHRFWRLTPVYMLIILLVTTMLPYVSSGPMYYTLYTDFPGYTSTVTACKKYWWTNLLYINNLYPVHMLDECLNWTWYLANDMQFYVISPFIFYLLYRSRALGFGLIGALMVVCFTSTAFVSWKYDLAPGRAQPSFHNNTMTQAEDFIYVKPWSRIDSYLVGMIAGYVLHVTRGRQVPIPKVVYTVGWCCAIASGLGIVYGLYGTYHGDYQKQPQAVFYLTVSRTLWSAAVAWVAFACATGYGGPVNTLLGWRVWGPLAKMNYCAYLLHPIFVIVYYTSIIVPIHYTDLNMIYIFLGHLVLSYASAFIMSVCAEAPWMALEKLLFSRKSDGNGAKNQTQPDHVAAKKESEKKGDEKGLLSKWTNKSRSYQSM